MTKNFEDSYWKNHHRKLIQLRAEMKNHRLGDEWTNSPFEDELKATEEVIAYRQELKEERLIGDFGSLYEVPRHDCNYCKGYLFPNGYFMSVISFHCSYVSAYGNEDQPYEIAIRVDSTGDFVHLDGYDYRHDDVLGYLPLEDVADIFYQTRDLATHTS